MAALLSAMPRIPDASEPAVTEGEMNIARQDEIHPKPPIPERKCARFIVPNATIAYEHSHFGRTNGKSAAQDEVSPVVDISTAGIAFLTNHTPKLGGISLHLVCSEDREPIPLNGVVAYFVVRDAGLDYRYRVGVEFQAFSERKGQNSVYARGRLERLEQLFRFSRETPRLESL